MNSVLARQTISAIEDALNEKRTVAIYEIIEIVQELASKADSISVAELSQLIGRDPSMTEKIIRASNTIAFKVGGKRICAISDAVNSLGFQRVRDLAISILLMDSANEHMNPYEQREIASLSFCSGLMAHSLAVSENLPIDPNLAYLCSSLRNYGKLLMSGFLIDEYRQAKALSTSLGIDQAFQAIFGIQPLQLGKYLLESSNLPKGITNSLGHVSRETLAQLADNPQNQLLVMSELCVQVSEAAFDEEIAPEQFDHSLERILDRFERALPIGLGSVNAALVEIDAQFNVFTKTIGKLAKATPGAEMLRIRVHGTLKTEPLAAREKATPPLKTVPAVDPSKRKARFQEALSRLETEQAKPNTDIGGIYEIATEAIRDALDLDSCLVFRKEEGATDTFAARFGHGPLFKRIRSRPFVSARKRDIFGICISRKEEILIQDVNAGKTRSVIPDWLDTIDCNESLVVLPIIAADHTVAMILGTLDQGAIQLSKSDQQRLREIRRLLSDLEVRDQQAKDKKLA